ncbi:hypothetical protein GE09DRAFT_1151585 [Coniochaeta sp. 2T2.1]|nr:hypothetical protein GE09DRAFT_1151585 [Coniochaeta sp. 2T2.1]
MSDEMGGFDTLKDRSELCRAQDDYKHALISDLFSYVKELTDKLSNAVESVQDSKIVIKAERSEKEDYKQQVRSLQLERTRSTFAYVVIDGECLLFTDELVAQGLDGGKRAAAQLRKAVENDLKSSVPASAHLPVISRVYANVAGLSKTYTEHGILSEPTIVAFIRGFNMGETMCDYVDAGTGKECSDEKVKGHVRQFLANVHCQQIFFGGTADNGYARLLGPYAEDEKASSRITLLEGPPFAHELAAIKDKFRTVRFEALFRTQKLPSTKRKVSFHVTPPATPAVDYASAASKGLTSTTPPRAAHENVPSVPQPTGAAALSLQVLRNKHGQRVDAPLNYSQSDFNALKVRKLCNTHYLLGKCPFEKNDGGCTHDHLARLAPKQLDALRAIARQSPCQFGLYCSNTDCIHGHSCTRPGCIIATCRFSKDMHDVDRQIV